MKDSINKNKWIVPTFVDKLFPPCTLEDSHIVNIVAKYDNAHEISHQGCL